MVSPSDPAHLSDYSPPPSSTTGSSVSFHTGCDRVIRDPSSSLFAACVRITRELSSGGVRRAGQLWRALSFFSPDDSANHGSLSVCLFPQPPCTHPGPPPGHHPVTAGLAPSQRPHVHGSPCFLAQLRIRWRRRLWGVWKFGAAQTARPPSPEHTQLARPPSRRLCPPSRGTGTQDQFFKPAGDQLPHR